jgi:hypothetical protein
MVVLARISCASYPTLLLCTPFMKVFFDGALPDDLTHSAIFIALLPLECTDIREQSIDPLCISYHGLRS